MLLFGLACGLFLWGCQGFEHGWPIWAILLCFLGSPMALAASVGVLFRRGPDFALAMLEFIFFFCP